MAKSMGNVIPPSEVTKKYGAEVLRLWVSMVDYRDDVRLSWDLLNQNAEAYMKIRNTIRYLIGNLHGFDPEKDKVPVEKMPEMDRYILYLFNRLIPRVVKAYDDYAFHIINRELLQFCTVTLSSFYLDIIKDRLYCSGEKSIERLSAQNVLYILLVHMLKLMAPILPFTAEEAWGYLYGENAPPIHAEVFPKAFIEEDAAVVERWDRLRDVRETVNKALETSRQKGEIGKSLEAKVVISVKDGSALSLLKQYEKVLPDVFIVSQVEVLEGEESVSVVPLEGDKCPRCWNVPVGFVKTGDDELCPRCAEVISGLS